MKVQLLIEGSPAALAAILANLPDDGTAILRGPDWAAPMPAPAPLPGGDGDDDSDDAPGNTAVVAGQLDADGLPHDTRIHSETPTLTDKGKWRKRRGVSKEDIAAVEAQLRAGLVAQAQPMMPTPAMPTPTPVPAMPSMPPVTDASGQAIQPAMPVAQPIPTPAPAMPAAAPVAQPVVAAAPTDFAAFMTHIGEKMNLTGADGKPLITADYLQQITNEIATAFNQPLSVITDIGANPQMIQYASQLMMRDGRW